MKHIELNKQEITIFVQIVKALLQEDKLSEAYEEICKAMCFFPDNPEPHNLMGIMLEKQSLHSKAMNHFRAAYALDATYLPARQNLNKYGALFSRGVTAYDESDCAEEDCNRKYRIAYDEKGTGRVIPINEGNNDKK